MRRCWLVSGAHCRNATRWTSMDWTRTIRPTPIKCDLNGSGYTNIEEYLNGTDPPVFVDYTKRENNVNTLTADSCKPPHENSGDRDNNHPLK